MADKTYSSPAPNWQEACRRVKPAPLPATSGFGAGCNQLLEESYRHCVGLLAAQPGFAAKPMEDALFNVTKDGKAALFANHSSYKTANDLYFDVVEKEDGFFAFLEHLDIITADNPYDDAAGYSIQFEDYITKRDGLQDAYRQKCRKRGQIDYDTDKELAEFDLYFKTQLLDDYFYITMEHGLKKIVHNATHPTILPQATVDAHTIKNAHPHLGNGSYSITTDALIPLLEKLKEPQQGASLPQQHANDYLQDMIAHIARYNTLTNYQYQNLAKTVTNAAIKRTHTVPDDSPEAEPVENALRLMHDRIKTIVKKQFDAQHSALSKTTNAATGIG